MTRMETDCGPSLSRADHFLPGGRYNLEALANSVVAHVEALNRVGAPPEDFQWPSGKNELTCRITLFIMNACSFRRKGPLERSFLHARRDSGDGGTRDPNSVSSVSIGGRPRECVLRQSGGGRRTVGQTALDIRLSGLFFYLRICDRGKGFRRPGRDRPSSQEILKDWLPEPVSRYS
jgi:hypothetical protein